MTKATNNVINRVLVFYVLSVFRLVSILPFDATELGDLAVRGGAGGDRHPRGGRRHERDSADAVLSCLNSGLYVASRMNFALATAATRRGG